MLSVDSIVLLLYDHYLEHRNVAIDARSVTPHSIFFALRGKRLDGHAFVQQALHQGASYAVIDDARYKRDLRCVLVDDVLHTLQRLASYHRQQCDIPIVAITGSSGKTTTKELTQAVLKSSYVTTATQGNLNNHIGVPLTLLSIGDQTEIGVLEMGANHIGEIAQLCEIARPTHGLITNIGRVHIEGFGSLEGVLQGKRELYDYVAVHNGVIFMNTEDVMLQRIASQFAQPITYPQEEDFYHSKFIKADPWVVYRSENNQIVRTQLLGEYHFYNIASALCIGKYFRVDTTSANMAIQGYRPTNNRSQVITKGSNTILLDAYNANLFSTKASIRALRSMPGAHKVLILGEMAELGAESEANHQALGEFTAQSAYKAVLLCGPGMKAAKAKNPNASHFMHKEALAAYLTQHKFQHTDFLIKGSRFLALETLVACIH